MFTYNDGSCSLVGFEAEKGSLTMGVAEKRVTCEGFRSGEISNHNGYSWKTYHLWRLWKRLKSYNTENCKTYHPCKFWSSGSWVLSVFFESMNTWGDFMRFSSGRLAWFHSIDPRSRKPLRTPCVQRFWPF